MKSGAVIRLSKVGLSVGMCLPLYLLCLGIAHAGTACGHLKEKLSQTAAFLDCARRACRPEQKRPITFMGTVLCTRRAHLTPEGDESYDGDHLSLEYG